MEMGPSKSCEITLQEIVIKHNIWVAVSTIPVVKGGQQVENELLRS